MASTSGRPFAGLNEGHSTHRPPLFDGTHYTYWKERMKNYVQSENYDLWTVIEEGEEAIPTRKEEITKEVKERVSLYARARNTIFCAVNAEDYQKISRCKTAQEMWKKLEITYEGTSDVKMSKKIGRAHV